MLLISADVSFHTCPLKEFSPVTMTARLGAGGFAAGAVWPPVALPCCRASGAAATRTINTMIPIARAFMARILSISAVSQRRPQGPLTVGAHLNTFRRRAERIGANLLLRLC